MSAPTPPRQDTPGPAAGYGGHDDAAAAGIPRDRIQQLVVLGYITAVAMPPIGCIVGIVLAARLPKPDSRRGIWVAGLSVIAALVWVVALATGVMNPGSSTPT